MISVCEGIRDKECDYYKALIIIKKPGALRKSMKKGKGEKISDEEINAELAKLHKKDKDKEKPGDQLSKKDATKKKQLTLAKTLKGLK